MSILVSILLFYTVIEHSVMVSARGCPGSTCISPVWLERCNLSLSLSPTGLDEYRFRVCSCLHAVSLANFFLVAVIYGVYTSVIYRSIRDDFPLASVDIGTYMRLESSHSICL